MNRSVLAVEAAPRGVQPHSDAEAYFDVWSSSFSTPTVLVHPDLRIIWRNSAAEDMLVGRSPFSSAGGSLLCADRGLGGELRRFLSELDGPNAWIYPDDNAFWILRIDPLLPEGHEPAAAVMFYCHSLSTQYVWADFGRVFGLTRSETEIVKGLVGGASAEELSDNLKISIETVRTHIKRTYAKMNINNREQMFALLMQFRLT